VNFFKASDLLVFEDVNLTFSPLSNQISKILVEKSKSAYYNTDREDEVFQIQTGF